MESHSFYLGVDGGGSKTTAVVFDTLGRFVTGAVGESINYYSVGMDTARKNMKRIVEALNENIGGVIFDTAVIGMSALGSRASQEETAEFSSGIINAEKIIMDSDLYIALKALCAEGECAVVIAGTGSMVIIRDSFGKIHHAGGWGHILGDEGSGYRIGLAGIQAAIRAFDGGEDTALLKECLEFFGIEDMHGLIGLYYGEGVPRKRTAQFAINVRTCAEMNDNVSVKIIKEQAAELYKTAMSRISMISKDSPIGLWGGIFQHSKTFIEYFCSLLNAEGYTDVKLLPFTPEVGAIIACFDENGIKTDSNTLKLLKDTYNSEVCKVI